MHHSPSDRWDKYEKKLDATEMADDEPDKEKVEVVTEEEEDKDFPLSGLFCCYCHDYAIHIFDGMSLCHECFSKEMAELIKNRNKK